MTFIPWRRLTTIVAVIATPAVSCATPAARTPTQPVIEYRNAQCFTGNRFEPCRLFVAGDRFVAPVATPDSVVDLGGRWVVPPFGEAHNHNVEPGPRLDAQLAAYRRAGVLYVQNPNNLPQTRAAARARIGDAGPDVAFANGGITGPGGHPRLVADANIARGRWTAADGEGAFYHTVRDSADVDAAWRTLAASRPDIVKVYLLYADEYARRLTDTATIGWRGMDPTLLPQLVRRARAAGTRVAAHVETASDFRTAVRAGVDVIAHLPGFRGDERVSLADVSRFILTPADAQEAARSGIVVVTTVGGIAAYAAEQQDRALRDAADRLHASNLRVLRDAGVRIAIGSDEYGDTSVGEARYLAGLGVFSMPEIVRIWAVTTPQSIFPDQMIGQLTPGYEASFLVLDRDPGSGFDALQQITQAVFRGHTLPMR